MVYKSIQAIGYQVRTDPKDIHTGYREQYVGLEGDDDDIELRCELLKHVINETASNTSVDSSADTLKVFMAPEFFFRNGKGAYHFDRVNEILPIMRETVGKQRFADWLFVFGTAVSFRKVKKKKKKKKTLRIFNDALVQRGGTVSAALMVRKEYMSGVDFITGYKCHNCHKLINENWPMNHSGIVGGKHVELVPLEVHEPSGPGKEENANGNGRGIFHMGGITFGLEVCLDHARKRLRASPPAKGQFYPQVHLITSAGAVINDDAIACMKDGIIFIADAGHTGLNINDGTYHKPYAKERDPSTASPGSFSEIAAVALCAKDLDSAVKKWKSILGRGGGTIVVYEPRTIPPPIKA